MKRKTIYLTFLAGILFILVLVSLASGSVGVTVFQTAVSYWIFRDVKSNLDKEEPAQ